MTRLAFLDTETTGLDPERHDLWEIAYILRDKDGDSDHLYRVQPDLSKADPMGLTISGFYSRTLAVKWNDPAQLAYDVARDLDGRHIVGAVPNFDAAFLTKFLRTYDQCPTWHYHLIDVETLAVGYIHGYRQADSDYASHGQTFEPVTLPWRSDDISRALGVEPPEDRHTALGDARWARDLYDKIMAT